MTRRSPTTEMLPEDLREDEPKFGHVGGFCIFPRNEYTVSGEYAKTPIYTTLVVRLAQCGIFQKQELWQHVVTYTTKLGGSYGLLLSPHGEERAKLGLFFDEATDEEMRFHFEAFVSTHLERYTGGTVQRRRRFVCPACGKVFSEADVTYRRDHGFTYIKCIRCDTEVSLLDSEQRLAALSPSSVKEMEQAVDVQRDRESTATIRQGKVIVQETSKLQL